MENIKGAVREQMQGIFPNKGGKLKPEFFKDFIPPGEKGINKAGDEVEGTKVTTFLNRFRDRTPEILERAKVLQAGETKLEGESLDSEQAKQVAAPKPANLKPAVEPTLNVFSIIKKIKGKNKTNEDVEVFEKDYKTAVETLAKEMIDLATIRNSLREGVGRIPEGLSEKQIEEFNNKINAFDIVQSGKTGVNAKKNAENLRQTKTRKSCAQNHFLHAHSSPVYTSPNLILYALPIR